MWWKTSTGSYVNSAFARSAYAISLSGTSSYVVEVDIAGTSVVLSGIYATQSLAQDAARDLVQGFDPSTV